MKLEPIEDLIYTGLVQRMQQVFGCLPVITTASDKTALIARLRSGDQVEYPYMFLTIQSVAHNKESYSANGIARRGLTTLVEQDQIYNVRLMPVNIEIEVEFHTNKFQGIGSEAVLTFAKRWMFAYRCGYLKFNVEYGRLNVAVSMTLNESVSTPPLENKTETETAYKVTSSLTLHGYVSEAQLATQGRITSLEVDQVLTNGGGVVSGYQFIPFNKESL